MWSRLHGMSQRLTNNSPHTVLQRQGFSMGHFLTSVRVEIIDLNRKNKGLINTYFNTPKQHLNPLEYILIFSFESWWNKISMVWFGSGLFLEVQWIKSPQWQSQSYKFQKLAKNLEFCNNPYTRHTFWSCLIRCANMKWIRLVLWDI